MLATRLAAGTALGLMVLSLTACGDDKKNKKPATHGDGGDHGDDDGDDETTDGLRGLDGGVDIDPRSRDGDASVDGSVDASSVTCDLMDPQLGCGVARGEWVSFDRGVQIDRKTGLGWVPVTLTDAELREKDADDALELKCRELTATGLGELRIPEIADVRTWAAGCEKTTAAGSCPVKTDRAPATDAEACSCEGTPARGPHPSGGFCRPEVESCETLWVTTFCHPHSCTSHTHWFYDTATGAVVLGDYKSEIARRAKAYCVTDEPVALAAP